MVGCCESFACHPTPSARIQLKDHRDYLAILLNTVPPGLWCRDAVCGNKYLIFKLLVFTVLTITSDAFQSCIKHGRKWSRLDESLLLSLTEYQCITNSPHITNDISYLFSQSKIIVTASDTLCCKIPYMLYIHCVWCSLQRHTRGPVLLILMLL